MGKGSLKTLEVVVAATIKNIFGKLGTTDKSVNMIGIPDKMKDGDAVLILSLCMLSLITNLRVCYLVIVSFSGSKLSPINILITHLSSVSIWNVFMVILYVIEGSNIGNLLGYPGTCQALYFFRGTSNTVFLISIVGVFYETVRSLRPTFGELLIRRMICLMWIIAGIGNIPWIFMVKYQQKSGKNEMDTCRKINLQGKVPATLIYVIWKFFVYYAVLAIYMAYELYQLRSTHSSIPMFKSIPTLEKRRKFQKVRFLFLLFISFILLSIPCGILSSTLEVLERNVERSRIPYLDIFKRVLIIFTFTSHTVSPLMFVCVNKGISGMELCFGFKEVTKIQVRQELDDLEDESKVDEHDPLEGRRQRQRDGRKRKNQIKRISKVDPVTSMESMHVSESESEPGGISVMEIPVTSINFTREGSKSEQESSFVCWHHVSAEVVEDQGMAQVEGEQEIFV